MRGSKPPPVDLTVAERRELDALIRRHTTARQVALRARIIAAAAEGGSTVRLAMERGSKP